MPSRWITLKTIEESLHFDGFRRCSDCVYAIFKDGLPMYVGRTNALYYRLHGHKSRGVVPVSGDGITIKFSQDRKYGENLMREARLIAALNPPHNKAFRAKFKPWLPVGYWWPDEPYYPDYGEELAA